MEGLVEGLVGQRLVKPRQVKVFPSKCYILLCSVSACPENVFLMYPMFAPVSSLRVNTTMCTMCVRRGWMSHNCIHPNSLTDKKKKQRRQDLCGWQASRV
jgi:hypothetical protein